MGQSSSSIALPTNTSKTSYTLQNAFATLDEDYIEDRGACCVIKPRRASSRKDLGWKGYMLSQLRQLELEEWPTAIIKQLRDYEEALADTNYRIKVVEARLTRPRSNISVDGEHSGAFEFGTSYSTQLRESKATGNPFAANKANTINTTLNNSRMVRRDIQDVNTSIKQLLDTSDILDEKLYPSCYKELLNSMKADPMNRINLSANIPDASRFTNELNISKPVEMSHSMSTNKNFKSYQNNTIINQLGPVYRIQSQNNGLDLDAMRTEGCLLYYKQITGIIETHLNNEANIFRRLMNLFEAYFVKRYQNIADNSEISEQDKVKVSILIQKATKDLQQFSRILCDGINLYYDLQNLQRGKLATGYSIFSYDNMTNFVTTLIFSERIYHIIFKLFDIENAPVEQIYRRQLELLKDATPQDFGVAEEFCLNDRTLEYIRKKESIPEEQKDLASIELGLAEELLTISQNNAKQTLEQPRDRQDPSRINLSSQLKSFPYSKAVAALKALSYHRSPIHKSKSILKTVEMIGNSIDEFYEGLGLRNQGSLTADHTFSIFCYVITRSGVESILSHCRIINEFSTSNVMSSISGYYASTLEVCVKYLCR